VFVSYIKSCVTFKILLWHGYTPVAAVTNKFAREYVDFIFNDFEWNKPIFIILLGGKHVALRKVIILPICCWEVVAWI
jgi:hypothetical protein